MDEIKNKVLNVINKQRQVKVPQMGFSEYFIQNVSLVPESYSSSKPKTENIDDGDGLMKEEQSPDEEILQSIEEIYFKEDADTSLYEIQKLTKCEFDLQTIEKNMKDLKQQQKVISKKVLQLILNQRNACTEEFTNISETEKQLQETMWTCQKTRSYLNFAKQQLTTNSLEILAAYRKREITLQLLKILTTLKNIKMTDQTFQRLIDAGSYSEAIKLLLQTKTQTEAYKQYQCIESFTQKIQDTLIMTEVQLDGLLNGLPMTFDDFKYTELQRAYKLLGKTLIAMDQLHMNFISSIHSTAFSVLKSYVLQNGDDVRDQKLIFEQLCENIPADKYIDCLISMCKAFWKILVCYNQCVVWHQNTKLDEVGDEISCDEYVQEKLKKGQFRLWNDIQGKICLYINSSRIHQLKYEHFIQALAIMQRLKKVGIEFCDEPSEKLMETIQKQSMDFFDRYHRSCLEEIALFIDHEAWVQLTSFSNLTQLQEYRTLKRALNRHNKPITEAFLPPPPPPTTSQPQDTDSTNMSQDESSIYGSCGYFLRFNEKSSPFDGGFDVAMLEEDILAGIADESSCYYSEDSDEYEESEEKVDIIICNSSLTVLRCIGRYLQMCRLLHSISPKIVACMTELIDYHVLAVHELFSTDLPVAKDNLYTPLLDMTLKRVRENVLPKVKKWPPSTMMIDNDLDNSETLYGLAKRVVGVECCIHMVLQFQQLQGYLTHLLATVDSEGRFLEQYYENAKSFTEDLRKPIYMCSMARVVDIQVIMTAISKVKFDIQHVTVQHSGYIDSINRCIQLFAMRFEEINTIVPMPKVAIWNNLAHVLTHMLVEGYSITKKCSPGGRALMQLDFTHFLSLLELISGQKFPEHQTYVEQYVKAYYLPKDLLEDFIKKQTGYSAKHMTGLINCTCSNDKKTRQHLLNLVEISNGINDN